MASSVCVLLSLALVAIAIASPVPTTEDAPLVDLVEVVETVPEVVAVYEPAAAEPKHSVAKRSALRGDNPSNDLLADLEGLKYDSGLSSLEGRRIKFLPTWLG